MTNISIENKYKHTDRKTKKILKRFINKQFSEIVSQYVSHVLKYIFTGY